MFNKLLSHAVSNWTEFNETDYKTCKARVVYVMDVLRINRGISMRLLCVLRVM